MQRCEVLGPASSASFLVIAAILSVAILVPAMFFLPHRPERVTDVDPDEPIVTSGWLPRAFRVHGRVPAAARFHPSGSATSGATGTPPEEMGVDAETALVLHRMVALRGH